MTTTDHIFLPTRGVLADRLSAQYQRLQSAHGICTLAARMAGDVENQGETTAEEAVVLRTALHGLSDLLDSIRVAIDPDAAAGILEPDPEPAPEAVDGASAEAGPERRRYSSELTRDRLRAFAASMIPMPDTDTGTDDVYNRGRSAIERLVTRHPNAGLQETWPGYVELNREGVRLALEMFSEMAIDPDHEPSCLENWARDGGPFRNFVAEFLQRAKQAGPEVEEAFCAVLTDAAGTLATGGAHRDAEDYAIWYGFRGDDDE